MLYSKRDFVKTIFRVSSLLSFFEITREEMRFFPTRERVRQKISKETLFIIKTHSTTHATFTGSIFTSTHTPCTLLPHARAPRLLGYARGTFSFVRFEKFHEREENVSDSRVFGPLRHVSRRFRMFFFFPLSLILSRRCRSRR